MFYTRDVTRMLASSFIALAICLNASAQDPQQTNASANTSQQTTVHGIVRNGASGEPLPRALVRINGDASTGVLTDGEGRFEIADVPEGPQEFTVLKPGFMDEEEAGTNSVASNSHGFGHNVIIAAPMGDVVFTMEPTNSIQGLIQLSTGDVAQGIQVALLRRTVQDGRVVWQSEANAKTNSEGSYRFGELADGLYAVYTQPAMDSDAATNLVENGSGNNVARQGYASVFYPDARDLASAAKMRVAAGEQAQANIVLTLEPFQSVTATVAKPKDSAGESEDVSVQVMDGQQHQLPYSAQYDPATHTLQAWLPDGSYRLMAIVRSNTLRILSSRSDGTLNATAGQQRSIAGDVGFAVEGWPVSNLHIPLTPIASSPVQVTVQRSPNATTQTTDAQVFITLSQTGGWMTDGMVNSFVDGNISGTLVGTPPIAGAYWVHTAVGAKTLCVASFTAGSASLAHEPLVLGIAGAAAPLVLALRDDCARLTLSLPGSVGLGAGEERFYTVYAVPDFDSTEDVVPQTLRPSSGGRITLTGLTPGNYHVYTFDRPLALEYRNPEVLASLQGQAIAVAPGVETELTVEVPQR
jgi:hypothetical protein